MKQHEQHEQEDQARVEVQRKREAEEARQLTRNKATKHFDKKRRDRKYRR